MHPHSGPEGRRNTWLRSKFLLLTLLRKSFPELCASAHTCEKMKNKDVFSGGKVRSSKPSWQSITQSINPGNQSRDTQQTAVFPMWTNRRLFLLEAKWPGVFSAWDSPASGWTATRGAAIRCSRAGWRWGRSPDAPAWGRFQPCRSSRPQGCGPPMWTGRPCWRASWPGRWSAPPCSHKHCEKF